MDWQDGEDAYHNVIVAQMSKQRNVENPEHYLMRAIKYSVLKIYAHEQAEARNVEAYLHDDAPPCSDILRKGRESIDRSAPRAKRTHCHKGHALTDDNLIMIGGKRSCKQCGRERTASYRERLKQKEVCYA
jgi:hypothetical protein